VFTKTKHRDSIYKGVLKMRDRTNVTVLGVGYLGNGKYNSSPKGLGRRRYNAWFSMLWRCYSEGIKNLRPTYKDCKVDTRWHNFQNFCEDLESLEGYELWIDPKNKMQLDKDVKIKENKIYSKDTCKFVSPRENMSVVRSGKYLGTNIKTKNKEYFTNISVFCRKHNLHRANVSRCIKGDFLQSGGWSFIRL
jgi:hypothetical protein